MNVPTGYTALDMIGFTDKGVYNSATAYVKNDIVHYNGNLWKCLVDDTTAVTPAEGASWTVFLAEPTSAAEDIIATVEPSVVSTHQYTAGKQLILNDILYTVTAAVNIGDTLAVGTNIVASDTIVEQLTTKANTSSLATVATSGSYADLSNKPTLGTAAAKDVPASGNASTTEVVMGDDTRLSNDRNAADVYPWAKAANKPIYNGSEINTSAAQTGTAQSAVAATIASGTSMDAAIGDLLDNDVTINTDIGNVKQALSNEVTTRSALTAHNLLDTSIFSAYPNYFTVNANGSVTQKQTDSRAIDNCNFFNLAAGTYIISKDADTRMIIFDSANNKYVDTFDRQATFTLNADTKVTVKICISATFPITIKAMIRLASDTDETFGAYAPQNKDLLSYNDNGVLGAKNQFKTNLALLKTLNTSGTWSGNAYTFKGITYTVNSDLSIGASGTPESPNSYFLLSTNSGANKFSVPSRTWILNGCPSGGSTDSYLLQATVWDSSNTTHSDYRDIGNEMRFTADSSDSIVLTIIIKSGTVISGSLLFKPMLRLASDTDPTYQPYAMTNKELTKSVLYFTSVACAATTGNFATVSDSAITADHVVVDCVFANPSAITTDVTWTTSNGSVVLNGTCASATTANITLARKGN